MEVNSIWNYVDQLFDKQVTCHGRFGARALDNARCDVSITNVNLEGLAGNFVQQSSELGAYFNGNFHGVCRVGDSDTNVGRAFERCLQSMFPDEVAFVVFSVPGDCDSAITRGDILGKIQCQVKLNGVLNEKLVFELTEDEKYGIALENKVRGVELFKSGRVVDAFLRFNRAIKYLVSIELGEDGLPSVRVTDLAIMLYNNIASCHLKRGNFGHTITLCSKVLVVQPGNVKALFRRGLARVEMRDFDEAKIDFEQVLIVEPGNMAAITKLGELKHKTIEIHTNYASVVKKMFEL